MLVSSSLKVRIIKGKDLIACDSNGKSDPYCTMWVLGEKKKTHIKKKTLDPVWDETFVFPINNPNTDCLSIEVFDHDLVGKDDSMGGTRIKLLGLITNVEKIDYYPLSSKGAIEIGLTAIGFDSSGMSPQQAAEVAFATGKTIDVTQIPIAAPPQRWEINDPAKFYAMARKNHRAGWIQLFLNKPYYIGGETIVGRLDLNLTENIHANNVMIKWTGWEKTYIENTVTYTENNQVKQRKDVYKDDKVFFKDRVVLFKINGFLAVGTHSFNFSYQLPANLPGVFCHNEKHFNDVCKAATMYKVKAYIDMLGTDIKYKQSLVISELLTQRVLPVSKTKVKSFVFTSGKLQFTGEIGKNVFCPGEVIPVHVKVQNGAGKKVNAIKVKVHSSTQLKAKGFVKTIKNEVCRWKFPGVEKKSELDIVLSLQLPTNIYPSTNGNLVKCEYFLDIELDLPMALDLNIVPPIVIALLPAPGDNVWIWENFQGGWK